MFHCPKLFPLDSVESLFEEQCKDTEISLEFIDHFEKTFIGVKKRRGQKRGAALFDKTIWNTLKICWLVCRKRLMS